MDIKYLKDFYETKDEDKRLTSNNHGKIDFITTKHYIEKYLIKNSRILEVGAGTGVYSLHFAKEGYQVDSIELLEHNINIFKAKIDETMNISIHQGNAIDLSIFEDNTFDITLVLGPMYHLFSQSDKDKAISEAIRVTKKNGYIFFAYCTHDATIVRNFLIKGRLTELIDKGLVDSEYHCISNPELLFEMYHVEDFNNMMGKYPVTHLHSVAVNGISSHLSEYVDKLNSYEFNEWIKYHLATCERNDLIGYSNHVLYICKK